MGTEIERKFLVKDESWRAAIRSAATLRQGYLAIDGGMNVRVRTDGTEAWITIKGPATGLKRPEFEWPVPTAEADQLLDLCQGRVVQKTRYKVMVNHHVWEVDEFAGSNAGLVLAEIEMADEHERIDVPGWVGREVSGDRRFENASLSVIPYNLWAAADPGPPSRQSMQNDT